MKRCLLVSLFIIGAPAARANGRFPQNMSVTFKPNDDQKIWVGSTFGLAYSPDDGATWSWVCEQNLGYMGIHDPVYAVTSAGTIYATIYDGLRISRDGGCTFTKQPDLDGKWLSDVQRASDDTVWVAMQSTSLPNEVYLSRDDGGSFTPTGLMRPRAYWKTLRVAPSDPNRVYVTGYQMAEAVDAPGPPTPLLFRTDDAAGAGGWIEIPFGEAGAESQLKLLGVSRADPDVVFARIDAQTDRVFRSDDGGVGWLEVLSFVDDDARAFISSADGMTILIGSGYKGAMISHDGGMSFAPVDGAPQMFCGGIRDADEDDFICSGNWENQMALGRSTDLTTWTKVYRFVELAGPLECPAGTPQAMECAPNWCTICEMFGCPDPECGGPSPADGGRRDGGGGGAGNGGGGGCGCGIGRSLTVFWPLVVVGLLVVGLRRRRRRRW